VRLNPFEFIRTDQSLSTAQSTFLAACTRFISKACQTAACLSLRSVSVLVIIVMSLLIISIHSLSYSIGLQN
jgi:hypothetical protein